MIRDKILFLNSKDKKALKFVVSLLLFYLIFSQANLFMNSVTSYDGKYFMPWFAENFNYIQWLRTAIILPSVSIIKVFGFYPIHNNSDILIVDGPYMRINYSCLGLGVMSFLLAFVLAYPAKAISKIKIFILGLLSIYILNVLRISILGVLMSFFTSQRQNFKYHHEVFNIFVYICIFSLLYFWIKRNSNRELNN